MIDYRKLYSKYDKEDLINTCINLKEYKERLRKEVNKSYMICNEKDKEIERLNKELKFHKRNEKILIGCQNDVTEKLEELKTELQQKENIIKEVREYIMPNLITEWDIKNGGYVSGSDLPADAITPILELLDKEVN